MIQEEYQNILSENNMMTEAQFDEAAGEKDACYHKVKSRYKVWPSAYASGALVKCRKVGASNWGKTTTKEDEELENNLAKELDVYKNSQDQDQLSTRVEKAMDKEMNEDEEKYN